MTKLKRYITGMTLTLLAFVFTAYAQTMPIVQAADNNFSDGITVDSTLDTTDDNISDSICDDGDGNCTLRAAIEEANDTAGTQTIEFNITGTADFTNDGQNGYTIQPASALPEITETVIIDGYSQPGAQANTATSPEPLNGRLLIEIDGTNAGVLAGFRPTGNTGGATASEIRGLVINRFENSGIMTAATDIVIAGNYIGSDPAGLLARGNGYSGITSDTFNVGIDASAAIVGGTSPADRNLISGNESTGIYPTTDWVVQGNYVGVDVTGSTALPNNTVDTSGAMSIDDCSNVLVGGTEPGATNLVSGNGSFGIAPHNCPGIRIEGNLIGTDWTGQNAVPNLTGISISDDQTGSVIGGSTATARNIISGNTFGGIVTNATGGLRIEGNYIGLNIDGDEAIPNNYGIAAASDVIIGGSTAGRNVISGNTVFNVSVQGMQTPTVGSEVSGNYIGTNAAGEIDPAITNVQGEGVRVAANISGALVGGEAGNRIAGNRGSGVAVRSLTITNISVTITPSTSAILGNEIYGNVPGGSVPDSQGLGIDLYEATIPSPSGPADITTNTSDDTGPTSNDASDADAGPNGLMNFPVLNSATQTGNSLALNYDLDAADTPTDQYRVEFFANDTADASGYGEGQTFLGAVTATNGDGNTANLTIPGGTDLTGKVLSATTTAIDNTTNSGFGATSEFSAVLAAQVIATGTNNPTQSNNSTGNLSETGQKSLRQTMLIGLTFVASTAAIAIARRKFVYKLNR